jgi:hypothetical protein
MEECRLESGPARSRPPAHKPVDGAGAVGTSRASSSAGYCSLIPRRPSIDVRHAAFRRSNWIAAAPSMRFDPHRKAIRDHGRAVGTVGSDRAAGARPSVRFADSSRAT